ncbi:MAG: SelB C-terminal domain-containing protein [Desulfarculaceae bacterium]|nr:SelB C-terminal domain-containing protein [Desulfarculaceae bacterium]
MPTQQLKFKYRHLNDAKLFNILINRLSKDGTVVQEQNIVRLAGHEVALQVDQQETVKKIKKKYKEAGITPPFYKDICRELNLDKKNARDVLDILLKEKSIIKTKDDLYFDADRIEELKNEVVAFLEKNGEMTTPQFKEMTGISRKFVIPLIEYFDSINLTIRVGDTRQLRKKK